MGAACPAAEACQHDPDLNSPWPKLTDKLAKFTILLKPLILLAANSMLTLAFHIIEGISRCDSWERISWIILCHSVGIKSHGGPAKTVSTEEQVDSFWFVLFCFSLCHNKFQHSVVCFCFGFYAFRCLPTRMSIHHIRAQCPPRPEEHISSPETRVTEGCGAVMRVLTILGTTLLTHFNFDRVLAEAFLEQK